MPNFGAKGLPRTYAFIVDEAGGGADMKPCSYPIRAASYMLDITTETKPMAVSVWQVPVGNFCEKGGRFGPHQSAETVNGKTQSLRRTRSPGSRTSTPASGSSISAIPTT